MLKNANLDDEETLNQLQLFSQVNIMDWYEMDAETMKSVLDVFVELENKGEDVTSDMISDNIEHVKLGKLH